jgi:hypothetical protein
LVRKKWIAVALAVVVVLASFSIVAVTEFDGDHVKTWDEWLKYATDPFSYNPVLKYTVDHDITDPSLVKLILSLEDGGLDSDKKAFINYVSDLDNSLQQKVVDSFLADEKLSMNEKKVIDFLDYINTELIPKDAKIYYTDQEISDIKYNLINSILDNGKVDDIELQALEKLKTERWYVARDIINSGMINAGVLNENWDSDLKDEKPLSNIDEIRQGTNPLNKLENDPSNLSNRYAVIAAPTGFVSNDFEVKEMEKICEILKKNGYTDDNVFFVLDPGAGQIELVKDLPIKPDYEVKYINGERVPGDRPAQADHFLNYIKNLPSDENDLIFIYDTSHGNENSFYMGRSVDVSEFNGALSQMKCGESIIIFNICEGGAFVRSLHNLNQNPNMLLVSTLSETEYSGRGDEVVSLLKHLDSGVSTKEALDTFLQKSHEHSFHPVILSVRDEPFINPLVYTNPLHSPMP